MYSMCDEAESGYLPGRNGQRNKHGLNVPGRNGQRNKHGLNVLLSILRLEELFCRRGEYWCTAENSAKILPHLRFSCASFFVQLLLLTSRSGSFNSPTFLSYHPSIHRCSAA